MHSTREWKCSHCKKWVAVTYLKHIHVEKGELVETPRFHNDPVRDTESKRLARPLSVKTLKRFVKPPAAHS